MSEHPSDPEWQPITGINCVCCGESHNLTDIEPVLITYPEEPFFNHFQFTCGDQRARMFCIPKEKEDDLMAAGVPIAQCDTVHPAVVGAMENVTGVPYRPAGKLELLDVAEFEDRLTGIIGPQDIQW